MVIIRCPFPWVLGRSAGVSPPGLPRPVLRDPPFGGFPGRFVLDRVPEGEWTLRISCLGSRPSSIAGIALLRGR
jgi:hypothetical protein